MHELTKWSHDHWLVIATTLLLGVSAYYVGQFIINRATTRASRLAVRHNGSHSKGAIEKRAKTLSGLFITLWRILVIGLVSLILISVFFPNINLAPLFASAGVIGVAFGFGAQSLVKDFLSGIFIISENQYRVGDVIQIETFSGTVERIGARSTVFRDVDGNVHYFPNGQIQHVINKTMGYGVVRLTIGVAPSADLDRVIEIINTTAEKMAHEPDWKSKITETPCFTVVSQFTATNLELVVSGKTLPSDQWSVAAELRRRIFAAFEKEKIPLGSMAFAPNVPAQ